MTAGLGNRLPSPRAAAEADLWLDISEPIGVLGRAEQSGWTELQGLGEWPAPNEMSGYYLSVELDRIW
jgi:hypothetical protein